MKTRKVFLEMEPRLVAPKTGKPLRRKLPATERNKVIKETKAKKAEETLLNLIKRAKTLWRDFGDIFGDIDINQCELKCLDIIKKEKVKIGDVIFLWTGKRIRPAVVNYIRDGKVYSGETIYKDDEGHPWRHVYVSPYPSNLALVFRKKEGK